MYKIDDLKTNCIGLSFPEMHEIRIAETDKLVGLLTVIGGVCTVEFPDIRGEVIYESHPIGKHCFEYQEREYWIKEAKRAMAEHLNFLEGKGGNDDLPGKKE